MEDFRIKLAERVFRLRTLWPDTRRMSSDYLTDETPDFEVETDEEDIVFEQEMSLQEQPGVFYPPGYLETLAVYRRIAERLSEDACILMHGAAAAVDGEAYLFTARSGVGKTTHIRLWQERFGDRLTVVNGDKPILRLKDGRVYVCGTPWSGKEGLNTNVILPLKAICRLERGRENTIRELGFSEILPVLLEQSYPPVGRAGRRVLDFWTEAAKSLSFYSLHCGMEPEAAEVSWLGMNGNRI